MTNKAHQFEVGGLYTTGEESVDCDTLIGQIMSKCQVTYSFVMVLILSTSAHSD